MRPIIPLQFLIFFLAISVVASYGQSGIQGKITIKENGEAVIFGNVALFQNGTLVTGTETDFDGNYRIEKLMPGSYSFEVSYVGLETTKVHDIEVKDNALTQLDLVLDEGELVCSLNLGMNCFGYIVPLIDQSPGNSGKIITAEEIYPGVKPGRGISFNQKMPHTDPEKSWMAGAWNDLDHWSAWTSTVQNEFPLAKSHWQWPDLERYAVQVQNTTQTPIPNCEVSLLNHQNEVLWKSKTDINGQAELWSAFFSPNSLTIKIKHAKNEWTIEQPQPFPQKINHLEIEVPCPQEKLIEIAFVVDATGSMKDQIQFLREQAAQILRRTNRLQKDLKVRSSVIFYRDYDESFLVKKMDFSHRYAHLTEYLKQQPAAGGGDPTEAVEVALDSAIFSLDWSEEAISRIVFLWMDGAPKNDPATLQQLQNNVKAASEKGIKIIPLMASGATPIAAFLMRQMAIQTNGFYTYLTTDNTIEHQPLADVLLTTINQESAAFPCTTEGQPLVKEQTPDMEQAPFNLEVKSFPNPASYQLQVVANHPIDEIVVYNAVGQIITKKKNLESGAAQFNVENWAPGIYFLQIKKDQHFETQKIIVEPQNN